MLVKPEFNIVHTFLGLIKFFFQDGIARIRYTCGYHNLIMKK